VEVNEPLNTINGQCVGLDVELLRELSTDSDRCSLSGIWNFVLLAGVSVLCPVSWFSSNIHTHTLITALEQQACEVPFTVFFQYKITLCSDLFCVLA
jgi:hypothetical protein